MKKVLFTLMTAVLAYGSQAQLAQHKIHGSDGRHEQASRILTLPDGTSVIGGTVSTPVGKGGVFMDVNIFLTKLTANGTILWQRQIFTPGSTTSDDIVNSIRLASNGDILVAGVVGRTSGNQYAGNNAFVARLNPATGVMSWFNTFKQSTPGEVFEDVAELSDGRIIAVGTYNYDNTNSEKGLINVYSATGLFAYSQTVDPGGLDEFQGVAVDHNDVYITGRYTPSTSPDARIMQYVPGTSSGTINWEDGYSITGITSASGASLAHVLRFDKPFIRSGNLMVNGLAASDAAASTGSRHFIFKLNTASHGISQFSIGSGTANFANTVSYYPIDANTLITTENPNTSNYSLTSWTTPSTNSNVTHAVAFGTPSVTTARNFSPGADKIEIADVSMNGSNVYLTGTIRGGLAIENDIYYCISAAKLSSTQADCNPADNTPRLGVPRELGVSLISTRSSLSNSQRANVGEAPTTFVSEKICGDSVVPSSSTPCDQQCYWRIDGNNSINAGNFLGTTTAADLVMKTSNTEYARIKSSGEVGVHTNVPAANLDVECTPGNSYPSGLRFENLPPTDQTFPMLVVDPNGYIYQYHGSIHDYPRPAGGGDRSGTMNTEQELIALKEQVRVLTEYVTKLNNGAPVTGTAVRDAGAMDIYPNPSDGKVNIRYSIPGAFRSASLVITNTAGQRIMEQAITSSNGTSLVTIPSNVTATELICTLQVDGKAMSSQKLLLYKK